MPQWRWYSPSACERGGDETRRLARLEHRGAGAVAVEEDHRVVRVGQLVHHVDADHQHDLEARVGGDHPGRRSRRPVGNEAQAQPTSKVPAFLAPSLCCSDHRGRRRDVVGGVGAEDDEVHLLGFAPGALERLPRRRQRDVGRRPVVGRPPAARDPAGRLHLVDELRHDGVEARPQLVVRHLAFGQVAPGGDDVGVSGHGHLTCPGRCRRPPRSPRRARTTPRRRRARRTRWRCPPASPMRPSGVWATIVSMTFSGMAVRISVAMNPGATALTRIL